MQTVTAVEKRREGSLQVRVVREEFNSVCPAQFILSPLVMLPANMCTSPHIQVHNKQLLLLGLHGGHHNDFKDTSSSDQPSALSATNVLPQRLKVLQMVLYTMEEIVRVYIVISVRIQFKCIFLDQKKEQHKHR